MNYVRKPQDNFNAIFYEHDSNLQYIVNDKSYTGVKFHGLLGVS